jgi:hypothetical protein
MANSVTVFISKLTRKLAMAVLISALALVTCSLWIFSRDRSDFEEHRSLLIETVMVQRSEAKLAREKADLKISETTAAIEVQRQRVVQADKALATLHQLEPGALGRVFGDREALAAQEARVVKITELKTQAQTKMVELQRVLMDAEHAQAAISMRVAQLEREETELRNEAFAFEHYLRAAWKEGRWLVAAVFLLYLFGGLVVSMLQYYGWAALVARGRPVQLAEAASLAPSIGDSAVTVEDALWPGEILWVRKGFLQGHDDELSRRKRFILSWSHAVSCLCGGLVRLIELRNVRSDGAHRVIFASAEDPFAELAVISIPEDGVFVVRLGLVVGYVSGSDQPPVIRRFWRLFSWQSWVSGRFGYLEFKGPCRLVVAGVSAMTADRLSLRDDGKPSGSRYAQDGVVGFSPRLALKPVRSEGFGRYCRGQAPLFDLWAEGEGAILLRGTEGRGRKGMGERLLKRVGI